ncbi:hypothetical protein SNE40_009223 [Patella caerulea]|uniref:Uncharacterized protein n=1 Tax=Patella caerulea TaxID=87958 RepID=A0AAN8JP60_PATCE
MHRAFPPLKISVEIDEVCSDVQDEVMTELQTVMISPRVGLIGLKNTASTADIIEGLPNPHIASVGTIQESS